MAALYKSSLLIIIIVLDFFNESNAGAKKDEGKKLELKGNQSAGSTPGGSENERKGGTGSYLELRSVASTTRTSSVMDRSSVSEDDRELKASYKIKGGESAQPLIPKVSDAPIVSSGGNKDKKDEKIVDKKGEDKKIDKKGEAAPKRPELPRRISAFEVEMFNYIGGPIHVQDTKTIKRHPSFTDEYINLMKKKALEIESEASGWERWVYLKPMPAKYIHYRARLINKEDSTYYSKKLATTLLRNQGWAGFVDVELKKKKSASSPLNVTMLVIAWQSSNEKLDESEIFDMDMSLEKYRMELCN